MTSDDLTPAWEADPRVVHALAAALEVFPAAAEETDAVNALALVRARRDTRTAYQETRPTRRPGVSTLRIARGVGAAFALILVGLVLANSVRLSRSTNGVAAKSYVTRSGQRATVSLVDGTQVILAPRTTLTVEKGFNVAARTVTVRGEAYFTVPHTAGTPFLVRTGVVTTRVLGTAFTVVHNPDVHDVRIAVQQGKVSVEGRHRSMTLVANMIGRVTDSTVTATTVGDISTYVGWTTGRLLFRDAAIRDVLDAVGRWYGCDFRLADPDLARERITANFDFETRASALAALGTLLDVTMAVETRPDGIAVVTLSPRTVWPKSRPMRRDSQTFIQHSHEVGR